MRLVLLLSVVAFTAFFAVLLTLRRSQLDAENALELLEQQGGP